MDEVESYRKFLVGCDRVLFEDAGISGDITCVYTDETKQSVCLKLFLRFIACLKVELQERHLYLPDYKIAY